MEVTIESVLLGASILLLVSIASSKISSKLGIPALLLFLVVGMLAGSEGPGGFYFDNAQFAQSLGVLALVFILFAGGLDTNWTSVRPVLGMGLALATIGVLISGGLVGIFAVFVLGFSPLAGLLLGAIVSSTDAAAVFAVLRSRGIKLKDGLAPLVELESGSNDPMAVFLTVGLTELIAHSVLISQGATHPPSDDLGSILGDLVGLAPEFVLEMGVGAIVGYLLGRLAVIMINHIRLDYDGLYPVLTTALMLLVYGGAAFLHGNGFLAVYIAGLVIGNSDFVHKRSLTRFHDGFAWLMQVAMFLVLGLLVFPSQIVPVIGTGLIIALFVMFLARPISVFLALAAARLGWREKAFISWVGLRGAVPIILATFPLLAGIPSAATIFNLVFFIVIFSVLLQGTTLGQAARWLHVEASSRSLTTHHYPMEFVPAVGAESRMVEFTVPPGSPVVGRSIMQLGLPRGVLIVLISRGDDSIVPNGATVLREDDKLAVLANETDSAELAARVAK
jgi:cell volume regulation protein A